MDWHTSDVEKDLPKIKALKSVRDAYIRNDGLVILTKNLKHRLAWLPLPQMRIWIPLGSVYDEGYSGGVKYSYRHKTARYHRHPALDVRDNSVRTCVGKNIDDYRHARKHGAHMTAIQQLAMLQTIKKDR